jgi:hypothetical protein
MLKLIMFYVDQTLLHVIVSFSYCLNIIENQNEKFSNIIVNQKQKQKIP